MPDVPIETTGLHHVALRVRDLERSQEFYCAHFGMHVVWQPDRDTVYLSSGSDNLALHRTSGERGNEESQSLDHIGFLVATPAVVRDAAAQLETGGVRILRPAKAHRDGSFSCYVADPDGNVVQILYEPHISDPGQP